MRVHKIGDCGPEIVAQGSKAGMAEHLSDNDRMSAASEHLCCAGAAQCMRIDGLRDRPKLCVGSSLKKQLKKERFPTKEYKLL